MMEAAEHEASLSTVGSWAAPHRQQFVVGRDDLPGKACFLGIEGVLAIQHGVQDDPAAPDVRNLHATIACIVDEFVCTVPGELGDRCDHLKLQDDPVTHLGNRKWRSWRATLKDPACALLRC